MRDGGRDVVDLGAVGELHAARAVVGGAEDGFADLVHAGLREAAEAEDLALVQVEGDVFEEARHGDALYGEDDFVRDLFAVVRAVVVARDLAADHEALEVVLGDVAALYRVDVAAVAHDGDGVGFVEHLGEVVRDEDDAVPRRADAVHLFVEFLAALLRERRRRLVDDDDFRGEVGRLDDLDELSVLEIVLVDLLLRADVGELVFFQKLVRLPVHLARVLDAVFHEAVLVAEEDVLRDGEARERAELLHDDGDAFLVRLDLVFRVDFLAVEDEFPAVDRVDAGQHVGQRRFSGAVLADQRVHLAFVDVEGHVADGFRDAEGFG